MRFLHVTGLNYLLKGIVDFNEGSLINKFLVDDVENVDGVIEVVLENELCSLVYETPNDLTPLIDLKKEGIYCREYYENFTVIAQNFINVENDTIQIKLRNNEKDIDLDYIVPFLAFEKLLWLNKRFILHSSVVEVDGKSIAFVGKSGIGKSTQASLWQKYENAQIICGDRSAVCICDKNVSVYGIPFDGTAKVFLNKESTLAGIICLRQGNEEKLERLSAKEAFSEIYPQITVNPWNKEFQNDVIDFVFNLIKVVPVYRLTCQISKNAVDIVRGEIYDK